jgi:glycosyltransferase involved in cell wall biosynthesis
MLSSILEIDRGKVPELKERWVPAMRVAYVAPYQGPGLMERRPCLRNLALAGNVKIELIAELLRRYQHDLEVLSQGEVVEHRLKYYPPFSETRPFHSTIPVHYASALPIRFMNGWWSSRALLALFLERHRVSPFDLVIIYNLKRPQVECAAYAMERLGLPVVVEYEDDAFVDIHGRREQGLRVRGQLRRARRILDSVEGCTGVSPFLLSRVPAFIPRLLLRGVASQEILSFMKKRTEEKRNWVAYSGTLFRSKGLEPMITAWGIARLPGWELHIAGHGELADKLRKMAGNDPSIVFHGLLDRRENARFLSEAKIGISPHDLSETPGNLFAFKIIEYLAAGAHVVTTPMGALEPEFERGITYLADNRPETIATTLERVIGERLFERTAAKAAEDVYGPAAVANGLNKLLNEVVHSHRRGAQPGSTSLAERT